MKCKSILLILTVLFLSFNISFAFSSLEVDCEDIKYGQSSLIAIKLPGDARGDVYLTVNDESYNYTINSSNVYGLNGILVMPVEIDDLKIGEYNVSVNYSNMTANDSFKVEKAHKYSFNSSDLVKDYGNGTDFTVQVLADGEAVGANQNVSFHVNGVSYTRPTDSEGVAHLNINLEKGNYIVSYEYKTFKSYNNIMIL